MSHSCQLFRNVPDKNGYSCLNVTTIQHAPVNWPNSGGGEEQLKAMDRLL